MHKITLEASNLDGQELTLDISDIGGVSIKMPGTSLLIGEREGEEVMRFIKRIYKDISYQKYFAFNGIVLYGAEVGFINTDSECSFSIGGTKYTFSKTDHILQFLETFLVALNYDRLNNQEKREKEDK